MRQLTLLLCFGVACGPPPRTSVAPDGSSLEADAPAGEGETEEPLQEEEEEDTDAPIPVQRADCEQPVGGPIELSPDTAVEAYPRYDEELAAMDFEELPEEIPSDGLGGPLHRSLVAYMLEADLETLPEQLSRDEIATKGPMGQAVLGAWASAYNEGHEGVDLIFLRRGLHRFYQCDRAFPLTLEEFKSAVFDYLEVDSYELHSVPKDTTRRIWESHDLGVYVAATIDDDEVRETEIVLSGHRSDGALDFIAYGPEGQLMDRSQFVTADKSQLGGAAPYACISCHLERGGSFRINEIFPEM